MMPSVKHRASLTDRVAVRSGVVLDVAPLFEKERNSLRTTLVAHLAHPVGVHRAAPRPALAADDDPLNAGQVYPSDWADERFDAQEIDCSDAANYPDAIGNAAVLDRGPEPDVRRDGLARAGEEWADVLGALGQHLEHVLRARPHGRERLAAPRILRGRVPKIRHGIHENHRRAGDAARLGLHALRIAAQDTGPCAVFGGAVVSGLPGRVEACCHAHRIAVSAPCRVHGAPDERIPGVLSPFNLGCAHRAPSVRSLICREVVIKSVAVSSFL